MSAVQTKYRNENNPNNRSNSSNGKKSSDARNPGPPPGPLRAKRGRDHDQKTDPNLPPPARPSFTYPSNWKLPGDIKYGRAFPRSVLHDVPLITTDGSTKQFCVKFFALQICRSGDHKCYFSHSDPSKHGKQDELDNFFQNAYNITERRKTPD